MGSAVQSSPLTSTLTMRAFLTVFLASLTLLSITLWSDIPLWSTERGRLRLSLSITLSDRSLPDITLLTLLLREDFTMLESLLTLPCTLSLPLSTTVWLDTPDIIPMPYTARGRLRPSPSTDTDTPLTHTTVLSTTVLSDIPDIIPMPSTARGRLRLSPSTDTLPPELSLTFTTLVSWLPLVLDTLSPLLDTDMSLTPLTSVSAQTSPVSRFLVRWRRSSRVSYDENIRYQ